MHHPNGTLTRYDGYTIAMKYPHEGGPKKKAIHKMAKINVARARVITLECPRSLDSR